MADFEVASIRVGFKVDDEKLAQWFGDKVVKVKGGRYFIPSFFDFQYGNAKDEFTAKKSALKKLKSLGLADDSGLLRQSDQSPPTLQPQSLDCTSVSVIKSESVLEKGSGEKPLREVTTADLDAAYKAYPLKKGKSKGIEKLKAEIKTKQDLADLNRAIAIYAKEVAGRPPEKIKHFSSFVNMPWRDALDPDYGTSIAPTATQSQGADSWEAHAKRVLDAIVRAGTGSSANAERERILGAELNAIACRAGIQRIRELKRDSFTIRTLAGMLQAAAQVHGEAS